MFESRSSLSRWGARERRSPTSWGIERIRGVGLAGSLDCFGGHALSEWLDKRLDNRTSASDHCPSSLACHLSSPSSGPIQSQDFTVEPSRGFFSSILERIPSVGGESCFCFLDQASPSNWGCSASTGFYWYNNPTISPIARLARSPWIQVWAAE